MLKRLMPSLMLATLTAGLIAPMLVPQTAEAHPDRNYRRGNYYRGYTQYERHPYLKRAGVGAGIGAAAGAVLAPDGARVDTAVKGGLIGAGAGLGYAYLKNRGYLNRW
jgi:hypothetical protein